MTAYRMTTQQMTTGRVTAGDLTTGTDLPRSPFPALEPSDARPDA